MIMKSKLLLAIAILAILLCAGCTNQAPKEEKVVIVSGHPEWKPVMWLQEENQEQKIVGIGPEVVEKVFSELGFKVDSRFVGPWDAVQLKAKEGEIDAIVALYKTKDREQYLFYSVPYTVDPIEVFVKKGNEFVLQNPESLFEKKGIATIGDSYGQEIDDLISQQKLQITRVATPEQAFALLEKNEGDYFLYSLYSGRRVIAESNLTNIHELGTISHQNFYIGISKKSPIAELLPEINSILDRYNRDGTIQAIAQKY